MPNSAANLEDLSVSHQFFASTAPAQNTEKPADKVAPIGDQPSPAPLQAPGASDPAFKS
jgi:hypothetical protein